MTEQDEKPNAQFLIRKENFTLSKQEHHESGAEEKPEKLEIH